MALVGATVVSECFVIECDCAKRVTSKVDSSSGPGYCEEACEGLARIAQRWLSILDEATRYPPRHYDTPAQAEQHLRDEAVTRGPPGATRRFVGGLMEDEEELAEAGAPTPSSSYGH